MPPGWWGKNNQKNRGPRESNLHPLALKVCELAPKTTLSVCLVVLSKFICPHNWMEGKIIKQYLHA